jgi:DNA polymerase III delta prime subunit
MKISNDIIEKIFDKSDGDARRAIIMLQNLNYSSSNNTTITVDDIDSMCGSAMLSELEYIWNYCINNNINDMYDLVNYINKKCINIQDVLVYMKNQIINSKLTSSTKSNLISQIGVTEMRLIDKGDEFLQLLNILCIICNNFN